MKEILRLSLPFTVWIVGFCAMYALQGLSCSRHWPGEVDARPILIGAAGLYALAQAGVLFEVMRDTTASPFAKSAATVLAVAALAAAVWVSLPVLALSICR